MKTNSLKIREALARQVEEILPSRKGLEALMRKRKIRLYLGVDPTSPYLHLGHAIPLRKLKYFQELGHHVILVFGTFTTQIGDPSGRDEHRKTLTPGQIKMNMASYVQQVAKILDTSKIQIRYNGDWLGKLRFGDLIQLASHFTVSQLLERDMFQSRMEKGGEVWLSEFLYPLMQGYDSVAMNVDLEIGATDQTFNMLVGRKLQKICNRKEKFVLTTPLLIGLDGRKMSKTYGNTVNILDSPKEMFGKLMSLADEYMIHYFEMCTEVPMEEIRAKEKALGAGALSPRDLKAELAREIVVLYHGEKAAQHAEEEFSRIFQAKQIPSDVPKMRVDEKNIALLDLLVKIKLVQSKNEARRLVDQRGVKIDGETQEDGKRMVEIRKGMIVQVGKRKFVKIG